jgi:hypothetical protein
MLYRLLADATLVIHLLFVLFVALGGFLVLRWRKVAWVHLPAAVWGGLIELAGWICPLTPLENLLRRLGGEAGYTGGFIDHYVISLIYPEGLTRSMQLAVGVTVLVVNTAIYVWVFHGPGRRKGR